MIGHGSFLEAVNRGSSSTLGPAQVREEEEESDVGTTPKKKRFTGQPSWEKSSHSSTADQKVEAEMTMDLQEMAIDGEKDLVTWWKTVSSSCTWTFTQKTGV